MKIEKMQQDNYTSTNNESNEQLFVKFHMANSIARNVSNINNVWYVDSKTSNHMIRHGK
jgi:hypothetical protein